MSPTIASMLGVIAIAITVAVMLPEMSSVPIVLPVTMSHNGVYELQNNILGLNATSAVTETSENKVERAKNNFANRKYPTVMESKMKESNTTTQYPLLGKSKFVLFPNTAKGKYKPFYEDGDGDVNVTGRVGSTLLIDCRIGLLANVKVVWVRHSRSADMLQLLTVGREVYSADGRFKINYQYPNNWRLQIDYVTEHDGGLYECQIITHPQQSKKIYVTITGPILTVFDDGNRIISKEIYLTAGQPLTLKCEAKDINETLMETVAWTREDMLLFEDVAEKKWKEMLNGEEILVVESTLTFKSILPHHAANYSCCVLGKSSVTISIHVLTGKPVLARASSLWNSSCYLYFYKSHAVIFGLHCIAILIYFFTFVLP